MKTNLILVLLSGILRCTVFADENFPAKCKYIQFEGMPAKNYTGRCDELPPMCRRTFNISYIDIPPFGLEPKLLETMITQKCCYSCAKMSKQTTFSNISELLFSQVETSDFIYPFLAKSSSTVLHGYHFVPIVDVPSMFYITPKYLTVFEELLYGCLKLWPLVVTCLVLSVVSGFVIWVLETWYNPEEFPRSFLIGMFEGFWWSFVSMTTVGYGDLNVKSLPARLFSVVWILLGISMFGLTTSLITVELMKSIQPLDFDMYGEKVGVLHYRDYDSSLVVEHGGIVTGTPAAWNFFTDVVTLVTMLKNGDIAGFVLDKYTLTYVREYFQWKLRYPEAQDWSLTSNESEPVLNSAHSAEMSFFFNNTYKTLKEYKGEKMSYGSLVRHVEVFDYFNNAARDNRMAFNSKVGSEMNQLFPKADNTNLFTPSGPYFVSTISYLSVMLGVIAVFGCVYELWKRKMKGVTKKMLLSPVKDSAMNGSVYEEQMPL